MRTRQAELDRKWPQRLETKVGMRSQQRSNRKCPIAA